MNNKLVFLIITILFFLHRNAAAQGCGSFQLSTVQTADGADFGDGTVSISTSGAGPKVYIIYANKNQQIMTYLFLYTPTLDLPAGTFQFIAKDSASGCIDTSDITIVDTASHAVICGQLMPTYNEDDQCDTNDIKLYVYPNGSSSYSNVSYLWNTGDTTSYLDSLGSGTYTVYVTDRGTSCLDTFVITVTDMLCDPCESFSTSLNWEDSCSVNDVYIWAYTSGGSGHYQYLWSSGQSSRSLKMISAGSYTVIVSDSLKHCRDTLTISVTDDTCDFCTKYFKPNLMIEDRCLSGDVTLTVYGSSRTGTRYQWAHTSVDSGFLSGLSTGNFYVTITDSSNGCTDTLSRSVIDNIYKCCKADFELTNDTVNSATKVFTSRATFDYGSGYNRQLLWDFGNGSIDTGYYTTITYFTHQNFTVCHYIYDSLTYCADTACNTVISPPLGKNLKVIHFGEEYILPVDRTVRIFYRNIGTTLETGCTLEFRYPTGCTIRQTSRTPISNTGNKVIFFLGNLQPNKMGSIELKMSTPMTYSINSYLGDTAIIHTTLGDIDSFNNYSYTSNMVVGSYDPNDKTPNPSGLGPDRVLELETAKEISYLIRFQNEGNWRTYFVRVEDTIDPSFDMGSLLLGDVSHPFRMVKNGRKLIWYFDDIELTPKSVNEAKSSGYIQYSLKLKSGLANRTEIHNTAYIYFDYNPAIITNTTKHTLRSKFGSGGGNSGGGSNGGGSSAVISADPLNLDFVVSHDLAGIKVSSIHKITSIKIFDLSGRLLAYEKIMDKSGYIKLDKAAHNIYLIEAEIEGSSVVKKISF